MQSFGHAPTERRVLTYVARMFQPFESTGDPALPRIYLQVTIAGLSSQSCCPQIVHARTNGANERTHDWRVAAMSDVQLRLEGTRLAVFQEAVRVQQNIIANLEKKVLIWLAARTP